MKKTKGLLSELMAMRANLIELIVIAVLLALSVNLISSSLPSLILLSPTWTLIVGVIIGIVALVYSGLRFINTRHKTVSLKGLFIYDRRANTIISIPRYQYGSAIAEYLKAAFSEKKELKTWWEKEPLRKQIEVSDEGIIIKELRSHQLIAEATEYFVLTELSSHLSTYFRKDGYQKNKLETFSRNDIPDVLQKNHFLELFSNEMDDRPAFMEKNENKEKRFPTKLVFVKGDTAGFYVGGDIVRARGKRGEFYNRFELVLPENSKLNLSGDGEIEIRTSRFSLLITVDFTKMSMDVPDELYEFILCLDKKPKDIIEFEVHVNINVNFEPSSFISSRGWEYYYWVDSFIDSFERNFSIDAFFDSIGWNESLTVMRFMQSRFGKRESHIKRK
jgi:hypothetical protein